MNLGPILFIFIIKTMPDYFEDYETRVNFISQEDLDKNHKGMPHASWWKSHQRRRECKKSKSKDGIYSRPR